MTVSQTAIFDEFGRRLSLFQEAFTWDEVDGIVRSFVTVGHLLTVAFDPVTAARGMHALHKVVQTRPERPIDWHEISPEVPSNWEEIWDELDGYSDTFWPALMEEAHNLNAFAYYGILPTWELKDADKAGLAFTNVPAIVRQTVANLTKFLGLLPPGMDLYGRGEIERTCLAATGRLKIDQQGALTVHELAAVSRVSTKRLQNAVYAKTEEAPVMNKADGLIPAVTAQRWLQAREYLPSIWKEFLEYRCWELEGQTGGPAVSDRGTEEEETGDYLFVPVARDGTMFSPQFCQRLGKDGHPSYTIGAKGGERSFSDYEEALGELAKMSNPRWRRPNENGNFGIVSAEQWRRLNRTELLAI